MIRHYQVKFLSHFSSVVPKLFLFFNWLENFRHVACLKGDAARMTERVGPCENAFLTGRVSGTHK
jgi:hypothetical protein